jgi:hypothetical protein
MSLNNGLFKLVYCSHYNISPYQVLAYPWLGNLQSQIGWDPNYLKIEHKGGL